jgi:hypothetical protein
MIDNFSLGISHCLIMLAVWRLVSRPDLDLDDVPVPEKSAAGKSRFPSFLKGRGRA